MQARGFLNYRLKYCWLKVICCRPTCQPNELEWETKKKTGGVKQETKEISGGDMAHPGSLRIATACVSRINDAYTTTTAFC